MNADPKYPAPNTRPLNHEHHNTIVLQESHRVWGLHNFGKIPIHQPLLGALEELGELAHAHLKEEQGIRGSSEKHIADAKDAVGDTVIYLMDYCNRRGWSFAEILADTCESVWQRDWKKDPTKGGTDGKTPQGE